MNTVTITETANGGLDYNSETYTFSNLTQTEEFVNWLVEFFTKYGNVNSTPVSGGVFGDWRNITLYFGSRDDFVTIVTSPTRGIVTK